MKTPLQSSFRNNEDHDRVLGHQRSPKRIGRELALPINVASCFCLPRIEGFAPSLSVSVRFDSQNALHELRTIIFEILASVVRLSLFVII